MDIALVPLSLDALRLTAPRKVTGPLARVERLPWRTGAQSFNPDMPWLGQALQAPPFAEADTILTEGIHLHWTLPDALTRAHADGTFPPAPDRWSVTRPGAAWMVESDYAASDLRGAAQGQTLYPVVPTDDQPPWRRQGRQLTHDDWLAARPSIRVAPTAVGYGDPLFAAHYPSCRSVFGLHDPAPPAGDVIYDIVGWYSEASEDPLGAGLTLGEMAEDLFWDALPANPQDSDRTQAAPTRAVFYARITVAANPVPATLPAPLVAMGNTGPEALAAFSAMEAGTRNARQEIEAAIATLQHAGSLVHRDADHAQILDEARHREGFIAEPGGQRWAWRTRTDATEPALSDPKDAHRPAVPSRLMDLQSALNAAQRAHDAAARRLLDQRKQLLADWSKYMMLVAPQRDQVGSPLEPAEVLAFLTRAGIAPLRTAMAQLGRTDIALDDDGMLIAIKVVEPGPLSDDLVKAAEVALTEAAIWQATGLAGASDGRLKLEVDRQGRSFAAFDGQTELIPDPVEGWADPRLGRGHLVPDLHISVQVRVDAPGTVLSCGPEIALTVDAGARVSAQLGDTVLVGQAQRGRVHDLTLSYSTTTGVRGLWLDGKVLAMESGLALPPLGQSPMDHRLILAPDALTGRFSGAIGRLKVSLVPVEDANGAPSFADVPLPPPLGLAAGEDARFWRPRDPVIALKGPAAQASRRHGRGMLAAHLVTHADFDGLNAKTRAAQGAALPRLRKVIDGVLRADPADAGHITSATAPWHPLALEWETELHPMQAWGASTSVAPDDLTRVYELEPDGPELVPRPGQTPRFSQANISSGRAILTPFANALLKERQADAAGKGIDTNQLHTATTQSHDDTQSQALGGFHNALLQRREAMALPADDPLAPGREGRAFSRVEIEAALRPGSDAMPLGLSAARPNEPFVPLRAGRLQLRRLRVIDAFGQVLDIDPALSARAAAMDRAPTDPRAITLPPRLSQPARLDFRWLSAHSGLEEAAQTADTSPVCGWLVVNDLDRTIAVFSAEGHALGQIAPGAPHVWQPAPGAPPVPPEEFANATLAHVVRRLCHQGDVRAAAFRDAIFEALTHILPPLESLPPALSLLAGRPLAVVRTRLSLALKGAPAIDQSWDAFAEDLRRRNRSTGGIGRLQCPVRLGEGGRLDDGLVGFWTEGPDRRPTGPFIVPALGRNDQRPEGVIGPGDTGFTVHVMPDGPSQSFTMLIDPMGTVHATSGLQPVRTLDIPTAQFAGALSQIEAWFQTTPLLTPTARLELPLPAIDGRTWSWLARDGDTWTTLSSEMIKPPREDASFDGSNTLREGWLKLSRRPRR